MTKKAQGDLLKLLTVETTGEKVLSFIEDEYHDNFGFQWNKFSKLQLDSYNGSSESRDRLHNQSELIDQDFRNKLILEIGAGNGRFTEILLSYGARVIAVDYSEAINTNFSNHHEDVKKGNLQCIRADLFNLPIKRNSFDIVLCYGVIQHTGNNRLSLETLSSFVGPQGILLVDIYSNSLRHFNPWTYAIRPLFSFVKDDNLKIKIVENFVNLVFPIQLFLLKFLHGKKGIFKVFRYILNRSPNSVYGINLFLEGKISLEDAKSWSVCDTFDAWMPKHDQPVSFRKWNNMIELQSKLSDFSIRVIKECGQGNCAVLKSRK